MESNLDSIQGSHPWVVTGIVWTRSYPRYYPRQTCIYREGFTDLSRLNETGSLQFRAMLLTRQGISLSYVTQGW